MNAHEEFKNKLAKKPWCTNNLSFGVDVRPRDFAIKCKYIQPNTPWKVSWLVFDLDYADSAYAWQDANLPHPTFIIINKKNGHCHYLYGLRSPYIDSPRGRPGPKAYAAAIIDAYCLKLRADTAYKGPMCKNPLPFPDSPWIVISLDIFFDLGELAEYVELKSAKPVKITEEMDRGRNCFLFGTLSQWACKHVLDYKRANLGYDRWFADVFDKAEALNTTPEPLGNSEIRAISRSIAKWTWREFTLAEFSAIQRYRGRMGGRPKTTTKNGLPWDALGISRSKYYSLGMHLIK